MKLSRRMSALAGLAVCAASPAMAQVLLYDNGPLVTHPGQAIGGADASALQTALSLNVYGYGAQLSAGNRMADDFTVPPGQTFDITSVVFYAYQTGATTPTITHVNVQIWDGPPNAGGNVIFGDTTTNRLSSVTPVSMTNIYRPLDTNLTETGRQLQMVTADVGISLGAGTYWIDWQYDGSAAFAGPWQPPVTLLGQLGKPGANGLQSLAGAWTPLVDGGAATPQDVPFQLYGPPSGPSGACCRTDGTCFITNSAGCSAIGGIYRGDGSACATANCPQPPTGACCLPTGCSVLTQAQCMGQNGTYRGDNTVCATANCPPPSIYDETGDAGHTPSTAQVVSGQSGASLTQIRGTLNSTADADMFRFQICDEVNFTATTLGGTTFDAQLFLFDGNGMGVAFNDDDPTGAGGLNPRLSSTFVNSNGEYLIAISSYDNDALGATSFGQIWNDQPFAVERAPDGPAAGEPVGSFDLGGGGSGAYIIHLTGACFIGSGPACYANCDGSSTPPVLNVNDFICFQAAFAAGDPYANCDGSTTQPVLNVNDFICFQSAFAAGCP